MGRPKKHRIKKGEDDVLADASEGESGAAAIHVPGLIDDGRLTSFQLGIVGICAVVMLLDGLNTQVIAYIAPLVAKAWGVPRAGMGPVFSAGLAGLMVGYVVCPSVSARFGHKRVLVACILAFALFSFLTVKATDVAQMEVYRFLTGLGLGGATPSAIALTSEYSPKRLRATAVLAIFCGFSLGFVVAGVAAAQLLPHYGWHVLLMVSGGVPLVVAVAVVFALPDSLSFLASQKGGRIKVAAIVRRLAPAVAFSEATRFDLHAADTAGVPLLVLLDRRHAFGTAMIWLAFFVNLGVFYAL
ncbi:MAG: MFS transporter, partial [Cyanobacteria bacterium REEB65]|nr:MFS transporter [Cyanobacteria bacterium REEB65]